jgi:alpha-tubulin suppressor-like RCC1 family protein
MLLRMRAGVVVGALFLVVAGATARCGGDDSNPTDAGSDADAAQDVVGQDFYVPDVGPPTPTILDVAAGAQHTCAIVAYGGQHVTYCFGVDAALGGAKQGNLAVAASGLGSSPNLVAVASGHGAAHTCGTDTGKQVWCWGDDTLGQCGQGNPHANIATPAVAFDFQLGVAKATYLGVGTGSTCFVRSSDGKLLCFGDNTSCQTDFYDNTGCLAGATSGVPTTDTDVGFHNPSTIGLGAVHGCVAAEPLPSGNAALFCFGDNASLESGPAGNAITTPAANIASATPVTSIAAGDAHTCFVTAPPHTLVCFGKNDVHQADPTSATSPIDPSTPAVVALPQSGVPSVVAASASETCVADVTGNVYCFGQGHGSSIEPVIGVKDVAKIAMGGAHTCVIGHLPSDSISSPGELICWGDNTDGQAGQTAGTAVTNPTLVAIPATPPTQ